MELTGLWWFFGSLIPWLAFGARWLNFKNRTSPFLIESFVWCFRNSEAFQSLHPGFPGLSFVGRMLGASSATGTGTVGIVQEILELCQGATPFPPFEVSKTIGWASFVGGLWLLWRDVTTMWCLFLRVLLRNCSLKSEKSDLRICFHHVMFLLCTPFWGRFATEKMHRNMPTILGVPG